MSQQTTVLVPDIGDFDEVDVIDILVEVGDEVALEDPLVTLESDKATMDIPAPQAGKITSISVKIGDKVAEGSALVMLEIAENSDSDKETATPHSNTPQADEASNEPSEDVPKDTDQHIDIPPVAPQESSNTTLTSGNPSPVEVAVPDIGDFDVVDVIDIIAAPGVTVAVEDPLITLESDKATMDIPAPIAGDIISISVVVGDKVSEGHVFAVIQPTELSASPKVSELIPPKPVSEQSPDLRLDDLPQVPKLPAESTSQMPQDSASKRAYASPSVRKFARELGVELGKVSGSGRKGRVLKADVKSFVKENIGKGSGMNIPQAPNIDFSKFGEFDTVDLSKIQRLTGQNLHQSWVSIPHITQFDEADVTELEEFRKAQLKNVETTGIKLTMLAFLMKATVAVLKKHPNFNASLSPDGQSLIRKKYFNIGMAVNTELGLVVPVLRDVDKKGLNDIAMEIRELAVKARDRKLAPTEMQGACFTLSNLGGIAGTGFTPIINPPEVAILGVSPATIKPVFVDGEFLPRLMLPLSLSYDHRVIDGVAGATFTRELSSILGDIRQLLL